MTPAALYPYTVERRDVFGWEMLPRVPKGRDFASVRVSSRLGQKPLICNCKLLEVFSVGFGDIPVVFLYHFFCLFSFLVLSGVNILVFSIQKISTISGNALTFCEKLHSICSLSDLSCGKLFTCLKKYGCNVDSVEINTSLRMMRECSSKKMG